MSEGGGAIFTSMAGSRGEFLSTGRVWSRDIAVRFPAVWPGTAPCRHPEGGLWQGSTSPVLLDTPQHDFSFWPKNACSCFTACFVPVTNTPDNASLQFYQNRLLGVILYIILYCQPHLQPTKLMAPAGSISLPTERAQVRREHASEQPKLGALADPPEMRPPFLTACRHCPLVLLPLDIAGNIKEKNCESKAPVQAGLVAQTDGHKSLSCCASTLGMGWPWLLFLLEELHWWWPWWPAVRRNWGHHGEGRHRGKPIRHWDSPLESQGRTEMCR